MNKNKNSVNKKKEPLPTPFQNHKPNLKLDF